VWEAYKRVKANKGAAGVDGQSVADFEEDLRGNLYKIWNRMSSGTYFPPPVMAVEIPKSGSGGGTRMLGVPTVADRVARRRRRWHCRPVRSRSFILTRTGTGHAARRWTRSPHAASGAGRRTGCSTLMSPGSSTACRGTSWLRRLRRTSPPASVGWCCMWKRWLQAPLAMPDGTLAGRDRGTPQGSAISPVLANLFMHYAFDSWLEREFPAVQFERYADDAVVHCATEREARQVLAALTGRMEEVGLRLHPAKTKIVYCKDGRRRGSHEHTSFTFLGYTFRPRGARRANGSMFVGFQPAVGPGALKEMGQQIRQWRIHTRTRHDLNELARAINPIVAGWMNYYGRFYRSQMHPLLQRINTYLMRWAGKKYKRLRSYKRFKAWWLGVIDRDPKLFAHWAWTRELAGLR
jgi:RNA-directed DNA polymerase